MEQKWRVMMGLKGNQISAGSFNDFIGEINSDFTNHQSAKMNRINTKNWFSHMTTQNTNNTNIKLRTSFEK